MTETQAPTPGPLSGKDVKLLVKGDLLLCKTWGVVRFDRFDDSGVRAFVLDLANDQVRLMKPINMAFIGRPGADGWMPWSGGENPVPGQRVETRLRNGRPAFTETSDDLWWSHDPNSTWPDHQIIAFRLAPTAPVEASGSEREAVANLIKENVSGPSFRDDDLVAAQAQDRLLAADKIIAYLRPQPSGETREAVLRDALVQADLKIRSFPGTDQSDVDFIRDALSTTPARAEAQDEGAAGEPWGYAARRVRFRGSPTVGGWTPGKIGDGFYMLTVDDPDWEIVTLYAHPSPTPAADADRVRIAVEALEPFARLELPKKSVGNAGAYSLLHTDIRRAAEALAALKSEGK